MQRKTAGILLIVVPFPLLLFVLTAYAITRFIIASVVSTGEGPGATAVIGSLISIILNLTGIIAVFGILIGIPTGIYLIVTAESRNSAVPTSLPSITTEK